MCVTWKQPHHWTVSPWYGWQFPHSDLNRVFQSVSLLHHHLLSLPAAGPPLHVHGPAVLTGSQEGLAGIPGESSASSCELVSTVLNSECCLPGITAGLTNAVMVIRSGEPMSSKTKMLLFDHIFKIHLKLKCSLQSLGGIYNFII